MTHIFIINPMAGNGKALQSTREKIMACGEHCEIYETKAPRDATAYIRSYCKSHTDEELRFYACGGDGTAKEVVNGILGFENASMTCVPIGSGNDFVKYYGGAEAFDDISDLKENGQDKRIDVIQVGDEHSINACHFGFDTVVAKTMSKVRRMKFIGGRHAYTTGIIHALLCGMRNKADIFVDGEHINDGTFLLCTVANGQYVGGAFKCAPRAKNDDGYLEVCMAKPVSIFTFCRLIGAYRDGTHLTDPRFRKIITYRRAKKVEVVAPKGFMFSLDGEIISKERFTVEALPNAIRFVVPSKACGAPSAHTLTCDINKSEICKETV